MVWLSASVNGPRPGVTGLTEQRVVHLQNALRFEHTQQPLCRRPGPVSGPGARSAVRAATNESQTEAFLKTIEIETTETTETIGEETRVSAELSAVQASIDAAYEAALVLVRPDGHTAWRGERQPTDVLNCVDRIRGAF